MAPNIYSILYCHGYIALYIHRYISVYVGIYNTYYIKIFCAFIHIVHIYGRTEKEKAHYQRMRERKQSGDNQ